MIETKHNAYDSSSDEKFKPIENYGIIGDNRTSILICSDGSIGWACFPDFDSPSAFASLLDTDQGGSFIIRPKGNYRSSLSYESGTNILVTEFSTDTGRTRIRSFMPYIPGRKVSTAEVHFYLEAVTGKMEMEIIFKPRFNYGSIIPDIETDVCGARAYYNEKYSLSLSSDILLHFNSEKKSAEADFNVHAGDEICFALDWGSFKIHPVVSYQMLRRIRQTRQFWRQWLSKMKYYGRYREYVERSLLAIKLLIYDPTGAIIAAPTASLPEWIGGVRNWDYRYSWVRDSSFILRALFKSGFIDEGTAYLDWMFQTVLSSSRDPNLLKVLYGIRGETEIPESHLNLSGYKNSQPVRIGNLAAEQFQLDIYGSLVDAAYLYNTEGGVITITEWEHIYRIVDFVYRNWKKPDSGIWEARNEPKHYTYSKAWAWVALDRGAKLAKEMDESELEKFWNEEAEKIRYEVLEFGYNSKVNSFTNYYGSEELDSSILVLPELGIIEPDHPKFLSTLKAVKESLTAGTYPFLYRYLSDDGVGGKEGAFLLPSFWLAEVYAMMGDLKEARMIFEAVLEKSNPLGLFGEEIHPKTFEMLGNFPQGFSHLGLINAALRIEAKSIESRSQ